MNDTERSNSLAKPDTRHRGGYSPQHAVAANSIVKSHKILLIHKAMAAINKRIESKGPNPRSDGLTLKQTLKACKNDAALLNLLLQREYNPSKPASSPPSRGASDG